MVFFPTPLTAYDYNQISGNWFRAALPAYWKILEEKHEWARAIKPRHSSLYQKDKYRPEKIDARGIVGRLHPAFGKRDGFNITRTADALWRSVDKLHQAERHLERLKIIDKLRSHLYLEYQSDDRNFLLEETLEEATLTSEAAITTIFSALDILSHGLSEIFDLGQGDRTATFFNVVTNRMPLSDGEVGEPTRRSLEIDFPEHPVTKLLLAHRDNWIQELSEWRHWIIHHGTVTAGEYVGSGVLLVNPTAKPDFYGSQPVPRFATKILTEWTNSLRELTEALFGLLSEYADSFIVSAKLALEVEEETEISSPKNSQPIDIVNTFLQLWSKYDASDPEQIKFMFGRLSKKWQDEWTYQKFKTYIDNSSLVSFDMYPPFSHGTHPEYGHHYSLSGNLKFKDSVEQWHFTLVPVKNGQIRMIREPSSTPPSKTRRLQAEDYRSRQSGRDTGHRDIIFSAKISNISQDELKDVSVHIFWHYLSEAEQEIGTISSGSSAEFECSWPNACLPVGEFSAMWVERGRFRLRVVYRLETPEGDWWAEDLGFDKA